MKISVKGMVCRHCIEALERAIVRAGLTPVSIILGEAEIKENPDETSMRVLDKLIEAEGFKRILSADEEMVDHIKLAVIDHVRNPDHCRLNLSSCIEEHLHTPYPTLSRVFTALEGRTIEKFQMAQRVEWVKELLGYRQLTLAEIADMTGYSSAAHLSRSFKSVTGLTPSAYLAASSHPRKPINEV